MFQGSMPEGAAPSQALGEEGQTLGGEYGSEFQSSHIGPTFGAPTLLSSPACPMPFCHPFLPDRSAQGVEGSLLV